MSPASDMTITELNEAIITLVGVSRTFCALECITSHRTDNVRRLWEWAGDQGELIGNELYRLMMALDTSVAADSEEEHQRAIALAAGADLVPDQGWRIAVTRDGAHG